MNLWQAVGTAQGLIFLFQLVRTIYKNDRRNCPTSEYAAPVKLDDDSDGCEQESNTESLTIHKTLESAVREG